MVTASPRRTIEMVHRRDIPDPTRFAILLLAAALLLLLYALPASAELQARLSRNPVTIDESFQLTLQSDAGINGDPDFSVLERDFRILGQNQSQNIQMINGRVTRSSIWILTLMARHTGSLTIPAIAVGNERSNPLTILVEQAAPPDQGVAGDDIFLKVEARPMQAYPGQQILLNVRLYRAVSTDNASLSQPLTDDPDILLKKLGEDDQYETRIGNRRYLVVERRYAMFTQKTGTLNLAPLIFQGEVVQPGSRRDPLFNTPFGRFGTPGEVRRIQSKPISITIEPAPPMAAGAPWLPSSNLQLVESWGVDNPEFRVGEPVTRTLMLFADGLTAAQLPDIESELPKGLKQYPDQPSLRDRESPEGITGTHQIKVAIVPSSSGSFTLPAVKIDWWNVTTGRMETAGIPERRIEVLPAADPETTPAAALTTPETSVSQDTEQPASWFPDFTSALDRWLGALALFLGLGWLGTLIAWRYSRKRTPVPHPPAPPKAAPGSPGKIDTAALRDACQRNDPEAAARALLEWGRAHWPDSPPRTLGAIAERVSADELKREIARLEKTLYAESSPGWQGEALWRELKRERGAEPVKPEAQEPVAPLYPG